MKKKKKEKEKKSERRSNDTKYRQINKVYQTKNTTGCNKRHQQQSHYKELEIKQRDHGIHLLLK